MVAAQTVEARLASLEREVAEFKERFGRMTVQAGNWLERLAGSQEVDGEFAEVLALGRAARAADRMDVE